MNILAVTYCLSTNNGCGETAEIQYFEHVAAGNPSCLAAGSSKFFDFDWCGQVLT
jgi:hypothetical protein